MSDKLLDSLRLALSKNTKVHAWQIRSVRQSGHQTYLVQTQLESQRRSEGQSHTAAVFVRNGDLLGRSAMTIAPGEESTLERRVEEAVFMASLGGDQPWALPEASALPTVEAFDPSLVGSKVLETSSTLIDQWRAAVSSTQGVTPSSGELFCGGQWTRFENSAGFKAESRSTRVSLLSILLSSDGARAAERQSWEERRRAADLNIADIVGRVAAEARDLTGASLPPSGEYPVVIDAQEIGALFSPIQANSSGQGLYTKQSRFEVGKPLPIEGESGEPVTVISNALTPYGLTSYAFDGDGVPGQRVELVKDGVFVKPWTTKQYADYLETEPTGGFANLELPLGKTSMAELLSGEGPVLHVRAFSWLTPDQARGAFSSEIRVGYLYENSKRKPIKGGSVSGNLFTALGSARYASDRAFLGSYLGPAGIRFEKLSVSAA